ncbi:hypothetical protein VPH35_011792 [Triticum aestivum]
MVLGRVSFHQGRPSSLLRGIRAQPNQRRLLLWFIAEAEPRRRRCCFASREGKPATFPLPASASPSVASPAAAAGPAASDLLSGELGDSLAAESDAPPASARPQVQRYLVIGVHNVADNLQLPQQVFPRHL